MFSEKSHPAIQIAASGARQPHFQFLRHQIFRIDIWDIDFFDPRSRCFSSDNDCLVFRELSFYLDFFPEITLHISHFFMHRLNFSHCWRPLIRLGRMIGAIADSELQKWELIIYCTYPTIPSVPARSHFLRNPHQSLVVAAQLKLQVWIYKTHSDNNNKNTILRGTRACS